MKLVTLQALDENSVRCIVPDMIITHVKTEEDLFREAIDANIVLGVGADYFPELLRRCPTVRWVHTSTAGVDHYICKELISGNTILTCAKGGAAGRNLAEHALGLTLALSRNIAECARSGAWRRAELSLGPFELSEKKAGIAGFGAAGRDLADLLAGFHVDILAVKRNGPFGSHGNVRILSPESFMEMLQDRDVVYNFLPATAETKATFDRRAFAGMKRGALFVNVGRGSTVDTDALVEALRDGVIGGAGIDTVDPEPLPDGHPLWSMPNVIITPHIAGASPDRNDRNKLSFLENLRRFAKDKPLKNAVDPALGY